MKILFVFLIIGIGLVSCDSEENKKKTNEKVSNSPEETQEKETEEPENYSQTIKPEMVSTAFHFPEFEVPKGFTEETIDVSDSEYNADFSYTYLVHDEDQIFNELTVERIRKEIDTDLGYFELDGSPSSGFSVTCRPVSHHIDDKLISIQNIRDDYTQGGAHHNYSWFAINYNRKTQKLLEFDDVFQLQSEADKAAFIDLLESYNLSKCRRWERGVDYFKHLTFCFKQDSTVFMPMPEWSCGMVATTVPNEALKDFLK